MQVSKVIKRFDIPSIVLRCIYVSCSRTKFSKYSMSHVCSLVFSSFRVNTCEITENQNQNRNSENTVLLYFENLARLLDK